MEMILFKMAASQKLWNNHANHVGLITLLACSVLCGGYYVFLSGFNAIFLLLVGIILFSRKSNNVRKCKFYL